MDRNWSLATPEPPPLAVAEKVYKELKTRESYRGAFETEWWADFKGHELPGKVEHWIDKERLEDEAREAGYASEKLTMTLKWLEEGVGLGCEKETARMSTEKDNMDSAFEFGEQMTDTIQGWCDMGICAGPYTREELEAMGFKNIKINPMQIRVKANGKLRIILDLSSPHLKEWEERLGMPGSVNSGIDKKKYSCSMADTGEILRVLHRLGKDVEFTKVDWTSAYKHLGVKKEDLELQCIQWGGRIFVELRMTFGCKSSPFVFDIASDVIKEIAAKNVGMEKRDIPKCLDDCIPIQTRKSGLVPRLEAEYRRLCKAVKVRLAGNDYVGKTFSVCREGEVLGLNYNLNTWEWAIPEAKTLRLVEELKVIATSERVEKQLMERILGKINHYFKCIPGGKFARSWLLRLERDATWNGKDVKVDVVARHQAMWWIAALLTSMKGTPIPDPRNFVPESSVEIFTDAAGGGTGGEADGGMGGVTWEVPSKKKMMWTQFRWPQWLLDEGRSSLGVKFAQKLSTLEGLACLTQLVVGHKELRGGFVRIWCDNMGFVAAYAKGSSTCLYVATISKALHDVARGLDIGVIVTKTPRMSGPGERAADALSKGDMARAWEDIGEVRERERRRVPKTVVEWISDPVPDPELGLRILEEIRGQEDNMVWEPVRLTLRNLREGARDMMAEGKRAFAMMETNKKMEKRRAEKAKRGEGKRARVMPSMDTGDTEGGHRQGEPALTQ